VVGKNKIKIYIPLHSYMIVKECANNTSRLFTSSIF